MKKKKLKANPLIELIKNGIFRGHLHLPLLSSKRNNQWFHPRDDQLHCVGDVRPRPPELNSCQQRDVAFEGALVVVRNFEPRSASSLLILDYLRVYMGIFSIPNSAENKFEDVEWDEMFENDEIARFYIGFECKALLDLVSNLLDINSSQWSY